MVTIDKTTGAVTVDGTVTEEQKVAEVTLSVELNGQTGKATADIMQEAATRTVDIKLIPLTDEDGVYTEKYVRYADTKIGIAENAVLPKDTFQLDMYWNTIEKDTDDIEIPLPKAQCIVQDANTNEEIFNEIVDITTEINSISGVNYTRVDDTFIVEENTTTIQNSILLVLLLKYTYSESLSVSYKLNYYIYQAGTEIRTDPDPENGDFYYIQTFDGEKPIQAGFDSYTGEQDEYGVLCSVNNPFERHIEKDLLKHYGLYGTLFAEDGSDQDILDTYYKGILYYRFTYQANSSSEVKVLDEGVIDEYIASTQYIWTPSEVHETGTYKLTCSINEINDQDPDEGEPEPEPEPED